LVECLKPGTVRLNTPAKKISQSSTGVTVDVGDGTKFVCKRVIITVPSPSYQWMAFDPPLPEGKRILSERTNSVTP
jgi:monoamine oxidase